jgi:hypothetical protein
VGRQLIVGNLFRGAYATEHRSSPISPELAVTMAEIETETKNSSLITYMERSESLFDEMIQMCLWFVAASHHTHRTDQRDPRGNATDLSLLTTLSTGDIGRDPLSEYVILC